MPNPQHQIPRYPNVPLDEHLRYATHIRITCEAYVGPYPNRCSRIVIMQTAELYEMCRGAVTVADFQRRLVCRRCGRKGWASIRPASR